MPHDGHPTDGGIGRQVASRARSFGMKIVYHSRRGVPDQETLGAIWIFDSAELMRASGVLVLACPYTPEARGFIDAHEIARARPGLILINVGRGDLAVDEDLISALKSGTLAAAGLDVLAGEPNLDRRYLDLPNVFITPHIGSSTEATRRAMGRALISGLTVWRHGGRPDNLFRSKDASAIA